MIYLGNSNAKISISKDNKRSITASTATTSISLTGANDDATLFKVTMSANTTLTFTDFPSIANGESFAFTLMTVNDATAGRTLTFGNTVKWAGGILPPRTTSANAIDIWSFVYENSILYGSLAMADVK